MSRINKISGFYGRFERPISSLSLVLGFIFDAFTIKRADALFENLFILGYLVVIGVCIVLIHLKESKTGGEGSSPQAHFWYVNILQFCFGGVFSACLILYFRSADIFVVWPFVALLALTFIANEFLKPHYVRLTFQISLFFLSMYSFAIFLLPVVLHRIGAWVFLLSGLVSLVVISLFMLALFHFIKDKAPARAHESKKIIFFLVLGIFAVVNFLYFTNLIPPIPLSLKDAGVYHSIQKNEDGNYDVAYEDRGGKGYFDLYPGFHKTPASPVYVYSAIFSPKGLNITIVHEWQHYEEGARAWITESTVHLPVTGGRDGGFRTYSARSSARPGLSRVNIKTEQGQVIGRVRFTVVPSDAEPALITDIKR